MQWLYFNSLGERVLAEKPIDQWKVADLFDNFETIRARAARAPDIVDKATTRPDDALNLKARELLAAIDRDEESAAEKLIEIFRLAAIRGRTVVEQTREVTYLAAALSGNCNKIIAWLKWKGALRATRRS